MEFTVTQKQSLLMRKLVYNELVRLEQILKTEVFPMHRTRERLDNIRCLDEDLAAQHRASK